MSLVFCDCHHSFRRSPFIVFNSSIIICAVKMGEKQVNILISKIGATNITPYTTIMYSIMIATVLNMIAKVFNTNTL